MSNTFKKNMFSKILKHSSSLGIDSENIIVETVLESNRTFL